MDKQIHKLFLSNFIGGLYFYLPIFTLFLLDKNISLATIVYAQLAYSTTSFLAEVPTGILADRLGQHHSVALGYFADLLGFLIIVAFPSAATLILAQAIRGISGAFLSGSKEALLYEYTQKVNRNYKKDFSHLTSYEILGFALSTLLAGFAIQQFGQASYVPIFIVTIVAVFCAGIISMTFLPIKTNLDTGREKLHELKQSIKLFRSSKMLLVLFIIVGLTYEGRYLLLELYQPHLVQNNVAPFFLGAVLSVGSIINYFLLRNAYLIEKPLGAKLSLVTLASITGLLYIMFGLFSQPYLLIFSLVLLFGVFGMVSIFISDYVNRHTPSHIRATVLSSISFSKEIFKTGYKLIFGLAVGVLTLSTIFAFYGIVLVIGAVISYALLGCAEKTKGVN